MLTPERVRNLLNYNPSTGVFTWRTRRPGVRPGKVAGCQTKEGYVHIRVDGKQLQAHRLAVFYMTGTWPEGVVDHEDGDPGSQAWSNLRVVPQRVNCQNRKEHREGKLPGVSYIPGRDRWVAKISINGKQIRLGYFRTAEEGHAVYMAAVKSLPRKV